MTRASALGNATNGGHKSADRKDGTMSNFQFEWWTVQIIFEGWARPVEHEFKAKTKDNAIKQIEKYVEYTHSERNLSQPIWKREHPVHEVLWETLTFDRKGYQRLF